MQHEVVIIGIRYSFTGNHGHLFSSIGIA